MSKILIVEDDIMLNNGIAFNFQMDGFEVLSAKTIDEARNKVAEYDIDLIILDINLPDGNGFDFCKEVRVAKDMPIIFLTACDMELDIVTGLRIGGDDYITKPFSLNILREKVFVLLRRYGKEQKKDNIIKASDFEIDIDKMQVKKSGKVIDLAPTEYKLIKKLIECKGEVLMRQQLLDELWEKGCYIEEHALTVNINRLRNKIEENPSKPKYIKTVYGVGYIWAGED